MRFNKSQCEKSKYISKYLYVNYCNGYVDVCFIGILIRKCKLINVSTNEHVYFIKLNHMCYNLRCSHYQVLFLYPRELSCKYIKRNAKLSTVKLKCNFTGKLLSRAEKNVSEDFFALFNYEIVNKNRYYKFLPSKQEVDHFIMKFINI